MTAPKDFLTPQSMLTPGIAGAITTGISMPLVLNFDLKFKWIALCVSFLLALLIIRQLPQAVARLERCIYCALNTLIIFSVSVGAGININPPPTQVVAPIPPELLKLIESTQVGGIPDTEKSFSTWLGISNAIADNHTAPPQPDENRAEKDKEKDSEKDKANLSQEQLRRLQEYLKQQQSQTEAHKQHQQRWSW